MQYEGSDVFLVQGLREGDDLAAQQLINTYSAPLYRYLRRRCSCDEDASDVLSMVFQKVVASIHTYDPARGSFRTGFTKLRRAAGRTSTGAGAG